MPPKRKWLLGKTRTKRFRILDESLLRFEGLMALYGVKEFQEVMDAYVAWALKNGKLINLNKK